MPCTAFDLHTNQPQHSTVARGRYKKNRHNTAQNNYHVPAYLRASNKHTKQSSPGQNPFTSLIILKLTLHYLTSEKLQ
jgi:hypothetical protein